MFRKLALLVMLGVFAMGTVGCGEEKTAAPEAPSDKEVKDATDAAKDKIDEAAGDAKDALDKATN